jgi:uncharacterized protein (DUF302 family)
MIEPLKKELNMNFDEAIIHIEKALKEEGFSILLTKSISTVLEKKFSLTDYPKYTIILACAPELAKLGLEASLNVGFLFPCSFVLYEDDNKLFVAHVSIMRIAEEIGLATKEAMEPVLKETSKKIGAVWNKL